jgi:acyl-CoA reductase-like NAD-dependent aldehyde dehydrogenase
MSTLASGKDAAQPVASDREFFHVIDGKTVAGAAWFDVINPATGTPVGRCPDASREQLEQAVAAARAAQPAWAALSFTARRAALGQLAAAIRNHRDELATLITSEQGKPLARAYDEVERSASQMERLIMLEIESRVLSDNASGRVELHYRPLGVVGAITPWNMPLVLSVPKIAHALYTGNTIVVKPSPYTPLSALRLAEIALDIFPAGVLNMIGGGNDAGRWISEHTGIDKVSFTGSVATGKRVMASAAPTLKRLTLELGGNDAAIVLDDVDVRSVAPKLFAAAFANSGQICMAIKRLYVQRGVYDALAQALADIARSVVVGGGMESGVVLGPVQNAAQFAIVRGLLDDVRQCGGKFLAGGHVLERPGYFIAPTIVTGLAEGSRLIDEEPFGPVLPILCFDDVDEAIERANNTRHGLGGSVWTGDVEKGVALARRLDVGTAWVNQHIGLDAQVQFGGAKESGIGCEYGVAGLRQYMQAHVVNVLKAS